MVLATGAAVGVGIGEVGGGVEFDGEMVVGRKKGYFEVGVGAARDGEAGVGTEVSMGGWEGIEALMEEAQGGGSGIREGGGASLSRGPHEKVGEGGIHAVAAESADAFGMGFLPGGLDRQRDIGGPSCGGSGREANLIAQCFVSTAASVEHAVEEVDIAVKIIDDAHLRLAFAEAVQATDILCDAAFP